MLKPLLFATLAAIGNAIMVYGQRATAPTTNPFFFMFIAIVFCGTLFGISTLISRNGDESAYFATNWKMMIISGVGPVGLVESTADRYWQMISRRPRLAEKLLQVGASLASRNPRIVMERILSLINI